MVWSIKKQIDVMCILCHATHTHARAHHERSWCAVSPPPGVANQIFRVRLHSVVDDKLPVYTMVTDDRSVSHTTGARAFGWHSEVTISCSAFVRVAPHAHACKYEEEGICVVASTARAILVRLACILSEVIALPICAKTRGY